MDSSLAVASTVQVRGHLTGGVEMGRSVVQGSVLLEGLSPSTPRCENGRGGLPWTWVCKVGCGRRAEKTVALHSHYQA